MRNFINKYGTIIVIASILLATLLYIWNLTASKGGNWGNPNLAFYLDEENGQESVRSADEMPPLIGAAGKPTVVRAYKFTTDNGKTSRIYYLFKYSDKALAELANISKSDPRYIDVSSKGSLFRSPDPSSDWWPLDSPEAQSILAVPDGPKGIKPIPIAPAG